MTDPQYPGSAPPPPWYYAAVPPPPPPKKRRKATAWVTLSVTALLVAGGVAGFVMWQNATKAQYDAAVADLDEARDNVVAASTAATDVIEYGGEQQLAADTIQTQSVDGLFDAARYDDFTVSLTTLDTVLAAAPAEILPPSEPADLPAMPWERARTAEQIEALADETRDDLDDYAQEIETVAEATTAVNTAAADLFGSAADTAQALLDENISAENPTKVAFQRAADDVAQLDELDDSTASVVTVYVDAAAALAASQQAELDEKRGPLLADRLEVEQFARDLAPGLMLDFDWAPIVAGAGDGLSVGGTTHWWMDPGYATITLSDSVAELWGSRYDDMVRALVAHEIGHALTIRCGDLYDWSTQESIEQWATAWAIVQGYTGEGNGVSVYGEPPQSMIDAARGCS